MARKSNTTQESTGLTAFSFNGDVCKALKESCKAIFSAIPRNPGAGVNNLPSNIGTVMIDNTDVNWSGTVKNRTTGKITDISITGAFYPAKESIIPGYAYSQSKKTGDMVTRWQALQAGKVDNSGLTGTFLYFLTAFTRGQNNSYSTYLIGYVLNTLYPIVNQAYEVTLTTSGLSNTCPVLTDCAVEIWKSQAAVVQAAIDGIEKKPTATNKTEKVAIVATVIEG